MFVSQKGKAFSVSFCWSWPLSFFFFLFVFFFSLNSLNIYCCNIISIYKMRMTILYTVIHLPPPTAPNLHHTQTSKSRYSTASSPSWLRPPSAGGGGRRIKVRLKHFTWGFIKNAAICLNREVLRTQERGRRGGREGGTHMHATQMPTHTHTHVGATWSHKRTRIHTRTISLQVHQACFQRL